MYPRPPVTRTSPSLTAGRPLESRGPASPFAGPVVGLLPSVSFSLPEKTDETEDSDEDEEDDGRPMASGKEPDTRRIDGIKV